MLEQEYRNLKTQAAPDFWDRIEAGLKEHPERGAAGETMQAAAGKSSGESEVLQMKGRRESEMPENNGKESDGKLVRFRARYAYRAAAAAAVVVVLAAVPRLLELPQMDLLWNGAGGDAFRNEAAVFTAAQDEAGENESLGAADVNLPETTIEAGETFLAGADENGAGSLSGGQPEMQQSAQTSGSTASKVRAGVLSVNELRLAAYHPLDVPEGAVTVEEDMEYFTENALKDTQLLCLVQVETARFETDEAGAASRIVYDTVLKEIYYGSENPVPGSVLTIVSPIIGTAGPQSHTLYQLQESGVYLLPLTVRNGEWELVFPYAPQIQKTEDGQYLFHSGYYSLVGEGTFIVLGNQEGPNDYYYDRMFLREDDGFLPELVELIEAQVREDSE